MEKINKICTLSKIFGEKMNGGVSDKEIVHFIETAKRELCIDIPKQYVDILKTVNGLEFNGFIVYGIDADLLDVSPVQPINGLIENNKIWYENPWQRKYVFLGDSNISWYVYDVVLSKYCELNKPSGDLLHSYDNFESLLNKILGDAIQ